LAGAGLGLSGWASVDSEALPVCTALSAACTPLQPKPIPIDDLMNDLRFI
jgi:hypothetical protein